MSKRAKSLFRIYFGANNTYFEPLNYEAKYFVFTYIPARLTCRIRANSIKHVFALNEISSKGFIIER